VSEPVPTQHVVSQALSTRSRQSPALWGRAQEPGRQSGSFLRLPTPRRHRGEGSGFTFRGEVGPKWVSGSASPRQARGCAAAAPWLWVSLLASVVAPTPARAQRRARGVVPRPGAPGRRIQGISAAWPQPGATSAGCGVAGTR